MKRIVFTVTNDLSFDQRMIKICSTLSSAGFDVHIIGFKRKNSASINIRNYQQERLNLLFQRGKLFYLETCIRLFFKLLFKKTDIISAVDMDTLLPAFLVSKIRAKKLVFDAHEYYSETSGLVGRTFEKSIWSGLETFLIPRIKYAFTVNQSLADIFKKKFTTDFNVILNVPILKESKKKTTEQSGRKFYLYQGILNKGRGLEELIKVFSENNLYLKIAGEGPLKVHLSNEIEKYGIGDRVELIGHINPDDLAEQSEQAYAGFNLIEGKSKSYYFSLANKFFDYIHAEIPQIGMNFPEYKRINDRFNVAILIDEFSEIKEAIIKLEEDKSYYDLLKMNTQKVRKEYKWSKEEEKLITIYRDLS